MFIRSVQIRDIRSISSLVWRLPESEPGPGWHVIVGDNGTGKSTFLRAAGLALVGPSVALALRQDWSHWVAAGEEEGFVTLRLCPDSTVDKYSGSGRTGKTQSLPAGVWIYRGDSPNVGTIKAIRPNGLNPNRHVWGKGDGWFSASYGPFRRFRGGDPEYKKLFYSQPKLGRHLSLFDESVALSECLDWLKDLRFKQLEKKEEAAILKPLLEFINQDGFLPFSAKLTKINSDCVRFTDGNDAVVDIENLSDGYRSILSLTLELIRQLAHCYGYEGVFERTDPTKVFSPGVVLIDEIDAHLHPTWQRRVGEWFRTRFPNIQFIVTTHSPIICQAANPGSVYRLPRPGTDEKGRFIKGNELKRLLYGSIEEAYGTEVFGDGITRSTASLALLDELAALNVRELDEELTATEKARLKELRSILPTVAYTTANGK